MTSAELIKGFVTGNIKRGACGNHTVTTIDGVAHYLLHGTCIAKFYSDEHTGALVLQLYNGGYKTVTTAKALNALIHELWPRDFQLKGWIVTNLNNGEKREFFDGIKLHLKPIGTENGSMAPSLGGK